MLDTIKINKGNIKMVAHAGLGGIECENTNAGYVAAGNRSYYGIETDFRPTADGEFVAIHDDSTEGRAEIVKIISQSTLEELKDVILVNRNTGEKRSDMRIPTLEEYFGICKRYGKIAIPELKDKWTKEQIASFVERIKKMEYLDNTVFISFIPENLHEIRRILPDQKIQLLLFYEFGDSTIEMMQKNKYDADVAWPRLSKELVDKLHDKGILVNCWNIDDMPVAEKMIEYGVDFITTGIFE